MKKLYIVTGAAGHLGSNIVRELTRKGEKVRGLVLQGESWTALQNLDVDIVFGNVCDPSSLEALLHVDEPSELIVIHTAGIVAIDGLNRQKIYDVNVGGTSNIVEACLAHNVKKLVYISSVHAIPEGEKGDVITETGHFSTDEVRGLYAQTKAQATQIVLDSTGRGLDAVVVFPSGIIGPGDYGSSHTSQLIVDYFNGRLTAGVKGGYDFVDVRDVAEGAIAAAEKGKAGGCYILSNIFVSVKGIFDILYGISKKRKIRTVLPLWFAKLTAPLAEIYYRIRGTKPLYTRYSLETLQSNGTFSHAKAAAELSYRPRDIRETIKDTVKWLAEHKRLKL